MEIDPAAEMSREAVGIFHSPEGLQDAIDELLSSGFHRAELSLLASEAAVVDKLGHMYRKVDALADDPDVPRAAYVAGEDIGDAEGGIIGGLVYIGATAGAIVASGGTLLAVIVAAALAGGAGGLIGVRARQMGRQPPRSLSAGAARARRTAALGPDARSRQRGAGGGDPRQIFGGEGPRPWAAVRGGRA